MYNLGDPYTYFEWFGTSLIIFIIKNGAGNRAAGRNDQKHHANTGPNMHGLTNPVSVQRNANSISQSTMMVAADKNQVSSSLTEKRGKCLGENNKSRRKQKHESNVKRKRKNRLVPTQ
jgi:CelD/BcsL family acetyltransferase involved in cellulose biosynthesis